MNQDILTLDQFKTIVDYIKENHWLIKGRNVKYIDVSMDMRSMGIWRIQFRCFGPNSPVFTYTNASAVFKQKSLYNHIFEWLQAVEK